MKKITLFLIVALSLVIIGCGKKAAPKPKESLNLPVPDHVEITLTDEGVQFINDSDKFAISIERAESEIGDITPPSFQKINYLDINSTFVDNTTEPDTRYVYRLRNYFPKYNAYSAYITKVVSYAGRIEIQSAEWEIKGNLLCAQIEYDSKYVSKINVLINGKDVTSYSPCFPLPPVQNILFVVIPYGESGVQGIAHSESIERDLAVSLLPPQNIKAIRSDGKVTVSWDAMPKSTGYHIEINGVKTVTDSTVFSQKVNGCVNIKIATEQGDLVSEYINIKSCE